MSNDGWLTIESAPKDGTEVLIYTPDRGVEVAYWTVGFDNIKEETWECFFTLSYDKRSDATHWRPLPPAPGTTAAIQTVEQLVEQWQADRSEWHRETIVEIVTEYAEWRERRLSAQSPSTTAAREREVEEAEKQQAYLEAVAAEFGGELPGDAWHLYRKSGLSPAEAAEEHRACLARLASLPVQTAQGGE